MEPLFLRKGTLVCDCISGTVVSDSVRHFSRSCFTEQRQIKSRPFKTLAGFGATFLS